VRDSSRYPTIIAVVFGALGFVLIFLGWNGAAEQTTTPAQFPYLISGGLAGAALVGVGMTLALVTELRRTTAQLSHRLDQLTELVAGDTPAVSTPAEVPTDGDGVVVRRGTYHRPDCRLVSSKTDLQPMTAMTAAERGLTRCRVCEPKVVSLPSIERA
jgi:hypothetical protein